MREDFEWFEKHYEEFQSKYGNAFLVIKDKRVIGVYDSYGDGVRETQKTETLGGSSLSLLDPLLIYIVKTPSATGRTPRR